MKYIGLLSSAASGKLGGIVASHNRGGTYFRHHAIPTQPRTAAQRAVRNALAAYSSAFKSLTAAQISGWNALGSTVTLKSKLGTTYHPTGQQLFVSCNKHLSEINISTVLTTAPTIPTIPAISTFAVTPGGTSGSPATVSSISYSVSPSLPSNFGAVLRASSVQSAGRTFVGKSLLRSLAGYNPATGTPADLFTPYVAKFGPLPQNGLIQFALKLVDPASGFAGPQVTANYPFYQPIGTDLFSIAVGAQAGATTSGSGSVTFAVTPTAIGGFAGAVNYSASNLPANCTYAFTSNPLAVGTPNTMTVTAAAAAAGTYTIDVTVSYGTFSVTTPATLTIVGETSL